MLFSFCCRLFRPTHLRHTFLFQGATIKAEEETGKIVIARIMHGGAADRSGLIHIGDEVVEVNNINVEGKTPNDVLKILVRVFFSVLVFCKSAMCEFAAKLGGYDYAEACAS